MSKDEFIKIVASDQPEVPMYFPKSAAKNLEGSSSLEDLPQPAILTTEQILAFDGVVIDVRPNTQYGEGHIPNSVNIGLGGQFASWAGTLIPIGARIAIAADTQEQVDEAFMRLARIGHETVVSYILLKDYKGEKRAIEQVPVEEVNELVRSGKELQFVDVRRVAEHANGHAPGTINIPLDKLGADFEKLDPRVPTYVICQGGYRSSIGTSILENAGFNMVNNVTGGTAAWIAAGLDTETSATQCAAAK
jgi:rhodanese-related sulfurtransferase